MPTASYAGGTCDDGNRGGREHADSSPLLPVRRADVRQFTEHGRGLRLVEALSAYWDCTARGTGKAVYAVLTRPA